MGPPSVSDLVFPERANHHWPTILGDLKKANLSIANRLRSIRQDAAFVDEVKAAFGRPLVANERCGSWYVRPERKAASAYFKSTDGHTGQWRFSTRRINLHLLALVGAHDGCIVVDSTRRGKRMPDALSKTLPVWCCVLNRVLFPDRPDTHELFVPPAVVSASEREQMAARVPGFVDALLALRLDLTPYRDALRKPLRPHWVTQDTRFGPDSAGQVFRDFHPVICCTSSRRVVDAEMSEGGYIQGAGDDTENWARGLTASTFWAHADELLAAPEAELPDLIVEITSAERDGGASAVQNAPIQLAPHLFVMPLPLPSGPAPSRQCRIALTTQVTEPETWIVSPTQMEVGLGKQRVARRNLRQALGPICSFVRRFLRECEEDDKHDGSEKSSVLLACDSGKDLSIGVALALVCCCFDDDGAVLAPDGKDGARLFTKTAIRAKLGRLMTVVRDANPNRATLQSVNSYLMERG